MKEREIPELLLKCCGKIYKPTSITILDNHVKITFFCPICRHWVYLENKNGMKKILSKPDSSKQVKKHSSFKYIKTNQRFANGKSDDFPKKGDT